MSRNRSWREKCAVYVVRTRPDVFIPISPWTWPLDFSDAVIHVRNVTIAEARTIARTFNKASMQRREANTTAWDGRWAIAGLFVRQKSRDKRPDAPERPQLTPAQLSNYTGATEGGAA